VGVAAPERVAIVFGGAGFIGTHLLRSLISTGRYGRIISADLKQPRQPVQGVEYRICDVRGPISFSEAFEQPDIYNLAAVHTTPGHEDWEYFCTNISGATNVCAFAERCESKALVFTSSIATYGPTETPRDESGSFVPDSAYGRSKLLAESIHRLWREGREDRRLIIVRPAVIFGAGEGGNFTRLAALLKSGRFVYPGRRDTVKACGYVGELVRSIEFARDLNETEIVYNFAYPERYTTQDICSAFHDVAGYPTPKVTVPLWLMLCGGFLFEVLAALGLKTSVNRARVYKLVNSTNIIPARLQAAGYEFQTDLHAGLQQWFNENGKNGFV
jgi:nucleoside-diphosphate-sugar epimerase